MDKMPVWNAKKMRLIEVVRSVGWLPLLSPFKRHERSLEKALPSDIVQRRRLLGSVRKWQSIIPLTVIIVSAACFPHFILLIGDIIALTDLYLKLFYLSSFAITFSGLISWSYFLEAKTHYGDASLISHSCISTGNATLDAVFRRDVFELEDTLVKNVFSKDDISILNNLVSSMKNMEKESHNVPGYGFQISLDSKSEALVARAARACGLDKEDSGALRSLSAPLDVLSSLGISPDLTARGGNKLLADNVP